MGIGYAIAEKFLARGANVTIVARNAKVLEDAAESLRARRIGESQKVHAIALDVGSGMEPVKKAFDEAMKQMGFVHTLVNNAGMYISREFDRTTEAEFESLWRVNVLGSVYATRSVLDGMRAHRQGRIIFVASMVAKAGMYGYTAYTASKWALRGLAEALQMEVKPYGILVSVVYPPDTDTPGYRVEVRDRPEVTRIILEGGVLQPEYVANHVVEYATSGYFSVSIGLDGWLLNQLHPGFNPVNNYWEVLQQILFSGVARFISACYTIGLYRQIHDHFKDEVKAK
jgi:3-dehydrosphinganine reductase